jgi:limonene-1,2-epoxide hydrolase
MSASATNAEVARAFSGHRFAEAYDRVADDVVWTLPGQARIEGRAALIAACEGTLEGNVGVTTSWVRFVATADGPVVAVDVVARYEGEDGVTAVASCDVYEFDGGLIRAITSYAVEVDPSDPLGERPTT